MTAALGLIGQSWAKQRILKKIYGYTLLSEQEGTKLLPYAENIKIECLDGCFNRNNYSYLFFCRWHNVLFRGEKEIRY